MNYLNRNLIKKSLALTTVVFSIFLLVCVENAEARYQKPKKPDPNKIATDLAKKASDAKTKGDLDKAISLYQQAFNVRYKSYGYRDVKAIDISTKLGKLYRLKKNYKKAEPYLAWSMKALVRLYSHGAIQQAPVLEEYARFYKDQDKLKDAIDKQKVAVALYEKKDDTDPLVFKVKVELANLYLEHGDYKKAEDQIKSAELLASDYEYKPEVELLKRASEIKKSIKENANKIVEKKEEPVKETLPKKMAVKKVEVKKKVAVAPKVSAKKEKPKNAAFSHANLNIVHTPLDALDKKAVVEGPLQKDRELLFQFIVKSKRYGIGVKTYVDLFDEVEAMAAAHYPESQIKDKMERITSSLQQQFQTKYALSRRPVTKKKKWVQPKANGKFFGIIPNPTGKMPERSYSLTRIEDKYAGTPLTEGYLRQIEREVVQAEMKRNPGVKSKYHANGHMRDLARRAKRRRIIKYKNREQRLDAR